MKITRTFLFLIALNLIVGSYALNAKVLYVDPTTGSDSRTYTSNSEIAPWSTIGRAAWGSPNRSTPNTGEAARAGDTVIVKAGNYSYAATNDRNNPAFNPVNSGTSGSPIVFRAVGVVNVSVSSSTGPIIGAYQKNYITWDGFTVTETSSSLRYDYGAVALEETTGSTLQNCTIVGAVASWGGDNHSGIRLESAVNATVKNNRIYGIRNTPTDENATAITLYSCTNTIIENNEMYSSDSGIYVKGCSSGGTQVGTIVRNNVIYGMTGCAINVGPCSTNARVYQNIMRDSGQGIKISNWLSQASGSIIANNTVNNCTWGVRIHGVGTAATPTVFKNNIVSNSTQFALFSSNEPSPGNLVFEHNLYYGFPRFWQGSDDNRTFAYWTGTFQKDTSASPASVSGIDPSFAAPASLDFTLRTDSPARTLGVDILDLDHDGSTANRIPAGAHVNGNDVIGRTGTLQPPSLRIVSNR